jgi:hypothetical protein
MWSIAIPKNGPPFAKVGLRFDPPIPETVADLVIVSRQGIGVKRFRFMSVQLASSS